VVISQDVNSITDASVSYELSGCRNVGDDVRKSVERFRASFVGLLNISKISDKVLEYLSPY